MLAFPLFSEMIVGFKTLYQLLSKVFKTFVGVVCRRCLCQKWTHFLAFLPWMGNVSHVDFQGHREAELKQWRYTTQRRPEWLHGDVSTSIFTHLTWLPESQLPQMTYELRMWMEMIWVLFGPFSLSGPVPGATTFDICSFSPWKKHVSTISHLPHWLPWLPWLICTLSKDSKRPSSESAMEIPPKHQKNYQLCIYIYIIISYTNTHIPWNPLYNI